MIFITNVCLAISICCQNGWQMEYVANGLAHLYANAIDKMGCTSPLVPLQRNTTFGMFSESLGGFLLTPAIKLYIRPDILFNHQYSHAPFYLQHSRDSKPRFSSTSKSGW